MNEREGRALNDYLDAIAAFVRHLGLNDLPAGVLGHAKLVMLDMVGVMLSGSRHVEIQTAAHHLVPANGNGLSTIIGTDLRASPQLAALINGTAGTWEEMDEGHASSKGHPGIHVIPAALALGEVVEATGGDVLVAIVAGYEVGARAGGASTLRDRFHGHGTWGTIGGAVAAAKLLGYEERRVRETINIAAALTLAPPYQTAIEGASVRNVYAGMANSTGLLAATLATSGFTGQRDGPSDVFGTVSGTAFDTQAMTRGLGQEYQITRNYFKLYPCCRHIHACIEAALKLRAEDGFAPEAVERIEVETYDRAALMCASPEAATQLAARFSIPYVVAQTLRYGEITTESFEPAAMADIAVRNLARQVTVRDGPAFTARRPRYRLARVTAHLQRGRCLSQVAEIDEGDPQSQVSPAAVREKFLRLAGPQVGADQAAQISETVDRLEKLDDVRQLARLLAVQ